MNESNQAAESPVQVEVTEHGTLEREITGTFPQDVVQKFFDARCAQVAQSMKMDGFRPGQVPPSVAEQRHGVQILKEMAPQLVEMGVSHAARQHQLHIAATTKVDHPDLSAAAPFTFTAKVELFPKTEAKGITGIELTREVAEVDADLLAKRMDDLRRNLQTWVETTEAAQQGDRVTVTGQGYRVTDDGEEAFEGGALEGFAIEIGSNMLIPGFEDALVGHTAGSDVEVNVTFPADYQAKELAGQPAVFRLKLDKTERGQAPDDDAMASQLGYETGEKLREALSTRLAAELQAASEQRLRRHLLDHLDEQNDMELPGTLVEQELNGLVHAQAQEIKQRGLTLEQAGLTVQDIKDELRDVAARRVKLGIVLAELAKMEKMNVTDAELRKAVLDRVEQAGSNAEQVRSYYGNDENRQQLIGPILEEKTTRWLLDSATITEKKVTAAELMEEFE